MFGFVSSGRAVGSGSFGLSERRTTKRTRESCKGGVCGSGSLVWGKVLLVEAGGWGMVGKQKGAMGLGLWGSWVRWGWASVSFGSFGEVCGVWFAELWLAVGSSGKSSGGGKLWGLFGFSGELWYNPFGSRRSAWPFIEKDDETCKGAVGSVWLFWNCGGGSCEAGLTLRRTGSGEGSCEGPFAGVGGSCGGALRLSAELCLAFPKPKMQNPKPKPQRPKGLLSFRLEETS